MAIYAHVCHSHVLFPAALSCRYFACGSTGPPLLLVHGFGVGAWHWEKNIEVLANQGYRVFAVDLLGQGGPVKESETEAPL